MPRSPTKIPSKASTRRIAQRDELWPDATSLVFPMVAGYSRIPRTQPLISMLIDSLGKKENAGPLYGVLWAHDFGEGFVETDPDGFVFEAGYSKARASRTWTERMKNLEALGFIRSAPRGHAEFGYVLLLDPHPVAVGLHAIRGGDFPKTWMQFFRSRCADIGIALPPPLAPSIAG